MVRPKKHLGQHFLNDRNIAKKITESLNSNLRNVLEVGAGTGVLTQFLLQDTTKELSVIEIDRESIAYLKRNFPTIPRLIEGDFLNYDLSTLYNEQFVIIGNFPYNISSQIFFKILENKNLVPEVVGMIQKEVAERLASKPGNKTYGILSVLLQAYYDIEYLFTVNENVFTPPPKVKSGVIRITRNKTENLGIDEVLFKRIIKTTFNQRRKTIRNSIKSISETPLPEHEFFSKRPEQLSVAEFVELTRHVSLALKC